MGHVAQWIRALVCGTKCRGFDSRHAPHNPFLALNEKEVIEMTSLTRKSPYVITEMKCDCGNDMVLKHNLRSGNGGVISVFKCSVCGNSESLQYKSEEDFNTGKPISA